jgi:hypothetical protein
MDYWKILKVSKVVYDDLPVVWTTYYVYILLQAHFGHVIGFVVLFFLELLFLGFLLTVLHKFWVCSFVFYVYLFLLETMAIGISCVAVCVYVFFFCVQFVYLCLLYDFIFPQAFSALTRSGFYAAHFQVIIL